MSYKGGEKPVNASAIILAAGQGTRMKSNLPKVLHEIAGLSMVEHVVRSVRAANLESIYLVVGHQGDLVRAVTPDVTHVVQNEQLGTGHAVNQCRDQLADFNGIVLVTYGDTPLFRGITFQNVLEYHRQAGVAATVITAEMLDPTGYGRIIRADDGYLTQIVEHKDATTEQRRISEINTGTYCFDSRLLFDYLTKITPNNVQSEYYLPDVIPLMIKDGHKVAGFCIDDPAESMGINDRVQLAEAESIMRQRINHEHMLNGVTIINPEQTYIDLDCKIGQDTVILPNTYVQNGTSIGNQCEIGSNVRLSGASIDNNVTIEQSVIVDSSIGEKTTVGPFAYIRPGTVINAECKIGDFVEVKNSTVGNNTKIPHHSYIGDSQVGSGVNVGCGTITCNYDGVKKYQTVIEDHVFIGSNSCLVAPVTIKEGAYVAAGSTITEDVPAQGLGIARARQVNKEGWKKTEG